MGRVVRRRVFEDNVFEDTRHSALSKALGLLIPRLSRLVGVLFFSPAEYEQLMASPPKNCVH